MKQKIIESLQTRIQNELTVRNPVSFLKDIPIDIIYSGFITVLYLYTRTGKGANKQTIYMAEVVTAIGHRIRNKMKLKVNSGLSAKTGAFLLYTAEILGLVLIDMTKGTNGHGSYAIEVIEEDILMGLWDEIPFEHIEKLPSKVPYDDWKSGIHSTGVPMVKTQSREVLALLSPEVQPLVFETLNKSQHVGWQINEQIYDLHLWALRNKTAAFQEIWDMQSSIARQSKIREAKAIGGIAKRFLGEVFFHLYYTDFRGRKYPATAYLHEQGSDLAKGLLLRADSGKIGEQGFFWLMISLANNWAGDAGREDGYKTDKIPLNDRVYWALDNEEIFIAYAENPKVNQGWMKADKPWQFLAACFELKKLRSWQDALSAETGVDHSTCYEYESHLECYVDGSNNGSQHLAALTLDEETAPLVNLVPSSLPGDLYKFVADHVWDYLDGEVKKIPKSRLPHIEYVIDTVADLKKRITDAPQMSERRQEMIAALNEFKKQQAQAIEEACPVFWSKITDNKHQRKIVKRNVMTISYGSTAYGMGSQQCEDARKHGIAQLLGMEQKWGAYMGRTVFNDCKISLKKPMRLLYVFEQAGKDAEARGAKDVAAGMPADKNSGYLNWTVPVTNFPVKQYYVKGAVKRVYVQYGPPKGPKLSTGYYENTLQLNICHIENPEYALGKQSQGASPNCIHSLDAAHLMMTSCAAPFPVTTIHDSFGALLCDMSDLYVIVREQFVELYKHKPLESLMQDIGGDISNVAIGDLDINLVLDSEYCFA